MSRSPQAGHQASSAEPVCTVNDYSCGYKQRCCLLWSICDCKVSSELLPFGFKMYCFCGVFRCAELLVMKAELELMQGEREESALDLEKVRTLLEICTG